MTNVNIERSTFKFERRIKEILNTEKLDSCLRRNDKKKTRRVRPHPIEESPDFTSGANKNPRLTAGANKRKNP